MRRPFSYLGDTWSEFFSNLLILLLIGPLYLFLCGLVLLWGLIGIVLRFPTPKQIPSVIVDDSISAEQKLHLYLDRFKQEIDHLEVEKSDESVRLKTIHATVQIEQLFDTCIAINLTGKDKKLDTGYWHTDEEENIDLYFWYAVAALKTGVKYEKNRFGREVGWIYSQPMCIWMGVSTNEDKYMSGFTKFARHKDL